MHLGESLTRGTVWLALTLYVTSEAMVATRPNHRGVAIAARLKALGCAFFLAHVAAAFQYFYNWNHAVALSETARQTKELTGWNSGNGLYFNYFFALVWMTQVIWGFAAPTRYSFRPAFWKWSGRAFFLFMIFNGAFVFVRGDIRWFGLALSLALIACWWIEAKRRIDGQPSPKSS